MSCCRPPEPPIGSVCCFSTCWGTLVCCLAREDTRRPTNANTAAFCLTSRNTLGVHNNTHSHSHPRHATFAKRVHRVHIWRDNIIWVIIILDYDQQQLTYMINKQCFDSFVLWVLVVFSFLTSVGASKSVFLYELRWNEKGVNTILKCQCKIKGWFILLLLLLLFFLSQLGCVWGAGLLRWALHPGEGPVWKPRGLGGATAQSCFSDACCAGE